MTQDEWTAIDRYITDSGASGFRVGPDSARGIEEMPWGG